MDSLKERQKIVKKILCKLNQPPAMVTDMEEFSQQLVFDELNGHYMLFTIGWEEKFTRIYTTIAHLVIKGNKIHIENDRTEDGIASLLLKEGVPNDDIVLNHIAPYKRPFVKVAA